MKVRIISIILPEDLVTRLDVLVKKEFRSRSELKEVLINYTSNNEKWEELFSYGKHVSKELDIKSGEDVDKIVAENRHSKNIS